MRAANASTPLLHRDANMIRAANENDMEAIIEVETTSFPDVYTDTEKLAQCRRRELEGGYPHHRVLAAGPQIGGEEAIHGLITVESYLRSSRQYRDSETGEEV